MKNEIYKTAIMICFALLSASADRAQTVNLQMQGDYIAGMDVHTPHFTVGDVNNDRLPDVVTLNKNNLSQVGPISVFINNGAGGFSTPSLDTPGLALSPNDVVIRDFNGDGIPDLAIAQDGIANGINIRLGSGTGSFPTGAFISNERGSIVIVSEDFNGDGHADLATCTNVNELRVLHGNGAGGFAAALPFSTASNCTDLITADFNVDGRPDIAVAMRLAPSDRTLQIFLNNGASFNAPVNIAAGSANEIVTADFNRDCIPDLATAQFAGSAAAAPIFIMIGDGAGGFTATTVNVTNFPRYMTVGDFNRDNKVDLAVRRNINGNPTANNLTVLPGDGAGGFGTPFEASIAPPATSTEMQIAVIDANVDGRNDLVIGRNGGFLLYHGTSPLFARTENDYDADGRTDLAVFRPTIGDWFIRRSTEGYYQQHWGTAADRLAPADYDGDFKTDPAVWRETGYGDPDRAYFFIFQSSDNTFRQEQFGRLGDDPSVVGDWDGDGRADPAVYRGGAASGDQSLFFYRPSGSPGVDFLAVPWGISGDEPVRGDFDGDLLTDAAVFRPSNAVWYVRQSSDGQPVFQNWGIATDRRVAADYDGDGRTDFAVFRPSDGIWYILRSSNGTPVFRRWGALGDALVPGDYNGDGAAEPAVYRPSDQRWYIPQCAGFSQTIEKFGAPGDAAVHAAP